VLGDLGHFFYLSEDLLRPPTSAEYRRLKALTL